MDAPRELRLPEDRLQDTTRTGGGHDRVCDALDLHLRSGPAGVITPYAHREQAVATVTHCIVPPLGDVDRSAPTPTRMSYGAIQTVNPLRSPTSPRLRARSTSRWRRLTTEGWSLRMIIRGRPGSVARATRARSVSMRR